MKKEVYEDCALSFVEEGTTEEILFTGFSSECGEVMSERQREVRKKENRSSEIVDELSDVLWYITVIANKRGLSLAELMLHSINKLEDRALNGKKSKFSIK